MRYKLKREQILKIDLETAWKFFSSPYNLSEITPNNMKFKVLTRELEEEIYEGMVIEYIVSPILNVPLKWRTLITQVDQFKSFTDEQERGPYRYWNHYHEFIPHQDGVLMKDTVTYKLPFGMIGNIAHSLLVKHKLEGIFDYRKEILNKLFNKKS